MVEVIALLVIASVAAGVILPLLARAVRAARPGVAAREPVQSGGRPSSPSASRHAVAVPAEPATSIAGEGVDFETALAEAGRRPDNTAQRLGTLIAEHPDEAAGVLRRWLADRP